MKTRLSTQTGQEISLIQQLVTSGEGEIWQTNHDDYLAKVYYSPTPARIRKLEVMVAHPPQDPNAHIHHVSFAWPQAVLKNDTGACIGFLMPAVKDSLELLEVYNPLRRQKAVPGFSWTYLHVTAMNIASIVWAIHAAGYVLGDLKPQNILVSNCALPSIIDTDSFQVRHPITGELHRCPVGSEGFTPPELMDQDLGTVEQSEIHDRFRLAIIIYLLLFGDHPFKGRWVGAGDSPDPNELLRQGWWPYAPSSPVQASRLTTPLAVVHPALQAFFLRCFNEGHGNPSLRPSASEWVQVLKQSLTDLKHCRKVKTHYFSTHYGRCYWCERKSSLGVDIFPALPKVATNPAIKIMQHINQKVLISPQTLKRALQPTSGQRDILDSVYRWKKALQKDIPWPQWLARPKGFHGGEGFNLLASRLRTFILKPQTLRLPLNHLSLPADRGFWVKPLGISGTILSLSVGLIYLSRVRWEGEEAGLTLVGGMFCLGLLALCWVLAKYTAQ